MCLINIDTQQSSLCRSKIDDKEAAMKNLNCTSATHEKVLNDEELKDAWQASMILYKTLPEDKLRKITLKDSQGMPVPFNAIPTIQDSAIDLIKITCEKNVIPYISRSHLKYQKLP